MKTTMMKRVGSFALAAALTVGAAITSAAAADASSTALTPDTGWYSESASTYTLKDADDLLGLASLVNNGNNFSGKTITIDAASIDLTGTGWEGLGTPTITSNSTTSSPMVSGGYSFAGTLQGSSISTTITVDRTGTTNGFGGLVNYLAPEGTVKNLTVTGTVTNTGSVDAVGGVVGYNSGTIDNVTSEVKVTANSAFNVGGIAGFNDGYYTAGAKGIILNSENAGAVSGNRKVGGITGENSGLIASCFNIAGISTTYNSKNGVGGIAGRNGNNNSAVETGIIQNCYNTADINGANGSWVGGITGFLNAKSSCVNCYDTGSITAYQYTDPIAGCTEGTVTNCYYLLGISGVQGYDKAIAVSKAEMTSADFVTKLADNTTGIWEQGTSYPVLTRTEQADGTSSGGGSSTVTGNEFYLSATGSDSNNGTTSTTAVATLSKAVDLAANSTSTGAKTIYVLNTVKVNGEEIYGTTSNDKPNITVKAAAGATGTNMFEVSGNVIIAGLKVEGAGFDNTFAVTDGASLKIRNNADISGKTVFHVLSGGSLTLNRSVIAGTAYSVYMEQGAKLFEIGVESSQIFTMTGTVYLGSGTFITLSDPLPCALTVVSAVTTRGTVIAQGTSSYPLTNTDLAKLTVSGHTLTLRTNQILILR